MIIVAEMHVRLHVPRTYAHASSNGERPYKHAACVQCSSDPDHVCT
jgi:hypothetical protein